LYSILDALVKKKKTNITAVLLKINEEAIKMLKNSVVSEIKDMINVEIMKKIWRRVIKYRVFFKLSSNAKKIKINEI
jgi:hypothetical protein